MNFLTYFMSFSTGNRIVLFAPVYLANWCVNTCQYCAFRGANKQMQRSMLTMDELR
jgi:2-iminoacetate synthase